MGTGLTFKIYVFQSAPGAQAWRNPSDPAFVPGLCCFNPPPALWPGGTHPALRVDGVTVVSIRPRRSGREELVFQNSQAALNGFQSAPGAQAGRTEPGR